MDRENKSADRIALGICLLISLVLSWAVHDRLSWGADDGFYAYMAERMAAGDIIHKDLQVLHPGFLYFFHELIFKITGEAFVSLRYPLILLTMLQTWLVFKIARPYGLFVAFAGALALTAFSFVQFVNPTPNWYLVFFAVLIGFVIDKSDMKSTRAIILIGALVGIAFLLRQLTGVFFAMAVTALIFLKSSQTEPISNSKFGSLILALLGVALLIYLFSSTKPVGFLLFGIWPAIFLFCVAARCSLNWQDTLSIIVKLVAGALLPALPIIIYHLATGTLGGLFDETFIAPFTYHGLGFISESSYALLPFMALRELADGNIKSLLGFLYWTILLGLNVVLAANVIRKTLRKPDQLSAIAVLAIFHALVALILEIPLYLNYIIGPVLLALLITTNSETRRRFLAGLTVALSLIAITFGAGQPIERGRINTVNLNKIDGTSATLPGTQVSASRATKDLYSGIVDLIEKCSGANDKIYVYPSNPEIYVLAKRQAAFRFTGSYLGLTSETNVSKASAHIKSNNGPTMIIHNTTDRYNTSLADELFDRVREDFQLISHIEPFDVFVKKPFTCE